jgi:ZIP family zinc transporter
VNGAVLITLVPAAATVAGAALAIWRPPGRLTIAAVQHLAAGVVFAAAATEILPDLKQQGVLPVIIGGGLGVLLMVVVKVAGERAGGSAGLIGVVAFDILVDGLVLGIGFAAGPQVGLLLTVALTLEVVFLGLSVTPPLAAVLRSRGRTLLAIVAMSLLLPLGAAAGGLVGGLPRPWIAGFLAFGLVALLYLVIEELLVEAHEQESPEAPWMAATFFVGFLGLLVLEEMLA